MYNVVKYCRKDNAVPTAAIRLSEEESQLIKHYARSRRRSVSDVIRLAILDQIEDQYDLELYRQAKAEFDADQTTVSHQEMLARHGLS
jgi:predicted DNA-binding protein